MGSGALSGGCWERRGVDGSVAARGVGPVSPNEVIHDGVALGATREVLGRRPVDSGSTPPCAGGRLAIIGLLLRRLLTRVGRI